MKRMSLFQQLLQNMGVFMKDFTAALLAIVFVLYSFDRTAFG